MRRFIALLTVCVLLGGVLCLPARADSAASSIDMAATVNSEGDCFVTLMVTLRLEAGRDQLTFPLPLNAKNVSMNGTSVTPSRSAASQDVDISRVTRGYVGEAPIRFEYTLPKVVKVIREDSVLGKKGDLQMELPLLSGFELPVEALSFTITMPSAGDFSPRFTSTYGQASAASSLKVIPNAGSQIIGASSVILNDRESMVMTMGVPKTMFPSVSTYIREGNPELVPMGICGGLALLYWLLFLFNRPLMPQRTSTPPEGISAGEMGCYLTQAGADLTTMVFTWAQLGYILMYMDGNGRVLLNKRMDMGNERGAFENKVFRLLFGSRRTVDATGNQYAVLCGKVAEMVPNERAMYQGNSGNMKVFRYLCCGAQIFCGICVAMNMASITALQVIMALILGVFGAVSAWLIQGVAYRTHLRGKNPVYVGLVCILLWSLLGLLCGQVWIPLGCSLGQWVMGYFAAYGGRRSDLGRHNASLVLGFRRYVKRLPRGEIGRLLNNDPEYFFNLAPYALALGVLKPFGSVFGRRKLEQCPYLMTRIHGKRTGDEWARLLVEAADMMDAKARRMQLERLIPFQLPKITIQMESQPKKRRR